MQTLSCRWFEKLAFDLGAASISIALPIENTLDEVFFYLDKEAFENTGSSVLVKRLDDLERFSSSAYAEIENARDSHLVKSFIDAHFSEHEGFDKVFKDFASALKGLRLRGVAIHAEQNQSFSLTLDFGYARDASDELLAVKFDHAGTFVGITHESYAPTSFFFSSISA